MTGEDLYENFKAALDFLGVGFRGMSDVQVYIDDTTLRILVNNKECAISIPRYDSRRNPAQSSQAATRDDIEADAALRCVKGV